MPGMEFLQLPGPTNIPASIQRVLHRPAEDFTDPGFQKMARRAIDGLRPVFGTDHEIFTFVTNGHGMWEVVFANLVDPGDLVLIPETGRFSEGWREMADDLGIETATVPNDWQSPIDPAAIEERLRDDHDHRIKAVLAVHIETSTGIVSNLAAIRAAIDRAGHPALLVVDAVASLAVTPIDMDQNRIDCVITASQKGLMLPPGLGFAAVGPRASAAAATCGHPRRVWDWSKRRGDQSYLWFYGTPLTQMMHGLSCAVQRLSDEGLDQVYARHHRLAAGVRAAITHWASGGTLWFNCSDPAHRSDAVTAIRFADGVDIEALRYHCRTRYHVAFAGGLGVLFGKILRIGHLGDLNEAMITGVLGALELSMIDHEIPVPAGGIDHAIRAMATAPDHPQTWD